jgi:hypothetical protein
MNEWRQHQYSRTVSVIDSIAKKQFGIENSEKQLDYWNAVFDVMTYLDDVLDQDAPRAERFAAYHDALQFIETGIEESPLDDPAATQNLLDLRAAILALGATRMPQVMRDAHSIALLGERLREAKDVRALGLIALAEGRVTSRLVSITESSHQSGDIAGFNEFLKLLGAYGNATDTLVDLRSDAKKGLTQISASPEDYLTLSKMLFPGIVRSVRQLNVGISAYVLQGTIKMVLRKK